MKNCLRAIGLGFALILILGNEIYAQERNRGKAFYTDEEVRQMCGVPIDPAKTSQLKDKQESMYKNYFTTLEKDPPKRFTVQSVPNWRSLMSDIEDQLDCGNCWVHAATGIVEGQLSILYGSRLNVDMNEHEVPNDCDGGFPTWAESYIRTNKLGSETGSYPNLYGVKWTLLSYNAISGISAIKNALASGPVAACFYVYADFPNYFYYHGTTSVYRYDGYSYLLAGHAVDIVSYDDAGQYWLCKNSWGYDWADNGYFRIGYGQCYIESWENSTVTVNQSCYAKLIPNLISPLNTAFGYWWVTGEWAYALGNAATTSSITLPAGSTFNIYPGVSLSFAAGTSLTANGLLTAPGTASQPITFTRSGTSGNWGSIQMSGAGAAGSSISYANFQYGTQIDVLNTSNVWIQHCNITNNTGHGINAYFSTGLLAQYNRIANSNYNHGILITGGSGNNCYDNVITKTNQNMQGAAIEYSGSTGYVARNDIRWYNWGVGAIWGASPSSRSSYYAMRNNRITGCQVGLMVYRQSYPNFGTPPPSDYMWNSIYSNNYNAQVGVSYPDYSSGLGAYGNWWGYSPPPSNYMVGPNSWFYFNPYIYIDPWYGVPLPSVDAQENMKAVVMASVSPTRLQEQVPGVLGGQPSDQSAILSDPVSTDPLANGIELRAEGKLKEAKDFFLSYLALHSSDQRAYVELYNCYDDKKNGADETSAQIVEYFKYLPSAASKDFKLLLSYLYLRQGDVKSAKEANNSVLAENKSSSLGARAKLNNFYISLYIENDTKTAEALLEEVLRVPKLSTEMELSTAEWALKSYVDPNSGEMPFSDFSGRGGGYPGRETDQDILLENYPNPFNPVTSISYQISAAGHVTLKVYDILGREVSTLVEEVKDAGRYDVTFDGSRLSSGVYFYRLTAPGMNQVKKMLMVK